MNRRVLIIDKRFDKSVARIRCQYPVYGIMLVQFPTID